MSKTTAKRTVSSFDDLPELYAELTATDDFTASFGDPLPLTIIEPGEEPAEHYMPEPIAAQAECGGIIASLFDLFTDTRLDPLAAQIAWGIVNSFHYTARKLKRQEDRLADEIGDMARRIDMSEVFTTELENKQLQCQSLAEQRASIRSMRDYAAAMYETYTNKVWTPPTGSVVSASSTASQISARDFLRARAEKERESHDPQGPCVVVSGPKDWHDWDILWNRLDLIHARIPHMYVVEMGQDTGTDAATRSWAKRRGVTSVYAPLEGTGRALKRAFDRNRKVNDKMEPVEAIICEGSGIQEHLYDLFNSGRGRRVPTHYFYRADQAPARPFKKPRRKAA